MPQFLPQREIRLEVLACGREMKLRKWHAFGALDRDRHAEQGRKPERFSAWPIRVFEKADYEMEHVASRLIDGEPRLAVELAAMRPELIGVKQRLQASRRSRRFGGGAGGHGQIEAGADAVLLGKLAVVGAADASADLHKLAFERLGKGQELHSIGIRHERVERGIYVRMNKLNRLRARVLEVQEPVAAREVKERAAQFLQGLKKRPGIHRVIWHGCFVG